MSLKPPKPHRTRRSALGFRLILWSAALFLLGNAVVLGSAYFILASSLRSRDRAAIVSELSDLREEYADDGLDGLKREAAAQIASRDQNAHLARLLDSNGRAIIDFRSKAWNGFDLKTPPLPAASRTPSWISVPGKNDAQYLEIASLRLPDGKLLQAGQSTAEREDVLERFRWILAAVLLPTILLGLGGGLVLTRRALVPIRHLARTLEAVKSGTMGVRAPVERTGDELEELSLLFNRMLERIESLITGMQNALDVVAHDLRTPMTRLRAIAELPLRSDPDLSSCREALADCVEESDKVLGMLNTLMDISEAETGAMALKIEPVEISRLLNETADVYRYCAEEKGVRLEIRCARELRLSCDRNRLRQVAANLIDNAVKYTPKGGVVALEAAQDGGFVALRIKDTGIGIPAQDLPKIWDRLYRGQAGRSQRGLGLGLSLVKAVVEAHGGQVEVLSAAGSGSCFTLRFKNASQSITQT